MLHKTPKLRIITGQQDGTATWLTATETFSCTPATAIPALATQHTDINRSQRHEVCPTQDLDSRAHSIHSR